MGWWVITLAIFVGFIYSSYRAWTKQNDVNRELKKNLETLANSTFTFAAMSFVLHDYSRNNEGSGISLWLCVKNHGGKSNLHGWHVKAINKGIPYSGDISRMQWGRWIPYRDYDGIEIGMADFKADDNIVHILRKPLKQNRSIEGFLRAKFPEMSFKELANPQTMIEISCLDISEARWGCCKQLQEMECGFILHDGMKSIDFKDA